MENAPKKLLVLGSLDEFVSLVEMARSRGIFTIVCDGYKGGAAKSVADACYDVDVRKIDTIAAICKKEGVSQIVTSFSDLLFECMVKIADRTGIPCYLSPEQLPYYRDKAVMKALLKKLGIGIPRFRLLKKDFLDEVFEEFSFPVVTKPLDLYGSRGLFVLENVAEVRIFFDTVCAFSQVKEILVEEYHTGHEFNMMSWVLDGQVVVLSIADREKTWTDSKDVPYSSRNVYPSCLLSSVYDEALDILQKYVQATEQMNGPLCMQFFWTPGEPIQVCEIAGRFFGYEHELLEYCSGLSIEQLLLDWMYDPCKLSAALRVHSPFFNRTSAVLYFQAKDGVIEDLSPIEVIAKRTAVKKLQCFYQKGDAVTPHGPMPYVARCYITGQTREEVDDETKQILALMQVTDPHGKQLLYQNALGNYE
jgi:phosphoribosylaminoimidazole carboxylase (NCAIR synthetase)